MVQYAALASSIIRSKSVAVPGTDLFCTVQYQTRKSAVLEILKDGNPVLKVPKHTTNVKLRGILEQHRDWIIEHSAQRKNQYDSVYADDAYIPLCGRLYRLKSAAENEVRLSEDCIFAPMKNREQALATFYARMAKQRMPAMVDLWSKRLNIAYAVVGISKAQKRWGSSSSAGRINLSYRVMMLPIACQEYVVVHELCHQRQMNHSPAFWAEVERAMPDYREREKQIKEAYVLP